MAEKMTITIDDLRNLVEYAKRAGTQDAWMEAFLIWGQQANDTIVALMHNAPIARRLRIRPEERKPNFSIGLIDDAALAAIKSGQQSIPPLIKKAIRVGKPRIDRDGNTLTSGAERAHRTHLIERAQSGYLYNFFCTRCMHSDLSTDDNGRFVLRRSCTALPSYEEEWGDEAAEVDRGG